MPKYFRVNSTMTDNIFYKIKIPKIIMNQSFKSNAGNPIIDTILKLNVGRIKMLHRKI